jgi:hypothetical protein
MAAFFEVLHYLSPGKSFYSVGETYEDIVWEEGSPRFTKEEFLATFETVDQIQNEKNQARVSALIKLQALGLTEDEAKAIAGFQD